MNRNIKRTPMGSARISFRSAKPGKIQRSDTSAPEEERDIGYKIVPYTYSGIDEGPTAEEDES